MRHRGLAFATLLVTVAVTWAAQDASTVYRTADAAFGSKAYDQAITGFKTFVEQFPDDKRAPRALYRIGECHGALGKLDEAAQAFQLCYKQYPDSPVADSAMFNEGFYYFRAQKWQPAAYAYYVYIRKGTQPAYKAQAWYWRGEALYQMQRYSDAIEAYQAMLKLPAAELQRPAVAELVPYARYSIAVSWHDSHEWAKAVAAAKDALEKHPDAAVAADSLWCGGQSLAQLKRYDEAVKWYLRLVDEHAKSPLAPNALYAAFELEDSHGHREAARQLMDRLARDYPTATAQAKGARFKTAAERLAARDFTTAQKLYREILQGASGDTEAAGLLGLGEASFGLEQWDEASKAYQSLLDKYPRDVGASRARLRLAEVRLRQDKPVEAEALYREYLKGALKGADSSLARYNLALAVLRQKRESEAITLFGDAAKDDPKGDSGAAALLEVGRLQLQAQKLTEARRAYEDFLQRRAARPEAAQAWWGVGEASYGLKDYPRAAESYQKLLDNWPNSDLVERTCYRLIEVYRLLGKADAADKVAALQRQKFPTSKLTAATLLAKGKEAFSAKRYAAAAEAFEAYVKAYPKSDDSATAMANLAASYYLADDLADHWPKAAKAYQNLVQAFPTATDDAQFWEGSAWSEAGQPGPAAEALQAFLKSQPRHAFTARANLLLGRSLLAQSQAGPAATALQVAIDLAKDDAGLRTEARNELAWAWLAAHKDDEAYAAFAALAQENPKHPLAADARFRVAGRLYQQRKYDEAITAYRQWLEQYTDHPFRPKATYNLALALEARGDYAAAAGGFAEAAKLLSPDDELRQQATYRIGFCLYRSGDLPGALRALEAYDTAYPKGKLRPEAAYYRGQALSGQQKWAEAGQVFKKLADEAPDNWLAPSARLNYGVALQNQQKYDDARAVYKTLVGQANLEPETLADARLRLGETLFALKRYDEALEHFLRAELGPVGSVQPAARYWAALIYQQKGETAKAREKLTRLINDSPQSEWAQKAKRVLNELK